MITTINHLLHKKDELLGSNIASRNELLREFLPYPALPTIYYLSYELCLLDVNQVLYESGDKIDFVNFPLDSVVSALRSWKMAQLSKLQW